MGHLVCSWEQVFEFYHTLYEQLKKNEVLFAILSARSKYYPQISAQEVLGFSLLKNMNEGYLKRKLIQLSLIADPDTGELLWTDNKGVFIPPQAFVIYQVVNPRAMDKAAISFVKRILEQAEKALIGQKISYNFVGIDRHMYSEIHKNISRKLYWIIDIDEKNENIVQEIINEFNENIVWITETHGGYHVIIRVNEVTGKLIFHEGVLNKYEKVEFKKDAMTPVPGTMQGGYLVRRYDKWP